MTLRALFALLALLLGASIARAEAPQGRFVELTVASVHIAGPRVTVRLPPDYEHSRRR